jgi:hypothetical protein
MPTLAVFQLYRGMNKFYTLILSTARPLEIQYVRVCRNKRQIKWTKPYILNIQI